MLTFTKNLFLGDNFARLELRDQLFNRMLHGKLDKDKEFLGDVNYAPREGIQVATRNARVIFLKGERDSPFASTHKSS